MHRTFCLVMILAAVTACAPHTSMTSDQTQELLSGQALFGEHIDVSDIQTSSVMALNDELRSYVASKVGSDRRARSRLEKLLGGMIEDGLLALDYDENRTFSAIETFNSRQGNCLSFSILFAALAREADLEFSFQMVDIPPDFRSDGEMIFLNNHINIRIKELRQDINFAMDYIVDFNTAEYDGNYDTREVDESYAIALYFGNLAAESMQAKNSKDAFRFLKKAIDTNSRVLDIWVNLGVLYSQHERPDLAEHAYRKALRIDPANRTALMNLATALKKQGRFDESLFYANRVEYYRNHHPYYHYSQARAAVRATDYQAAVGFLDEAIKLKDNEHQFYFLRALVFKRLNQVELAEQDIQKAIDMANEADVVSRYSSKFDALKTSLQ